MMYVEITFFVLLRRCQTTSKRRLFFFVFFLRINSLCIYRIRAIALAMCPAAVRSRVLLSLPIQLTIYKCPPTQRKPRRPYGLARSCRAASVCTPLRSSVRRRVRSRASPPPSRWPLSTVAPFKTFLLTSQKVASCNWQGSRIYLSTWSSR
jgi:hypothetical protein